MNRRDFIKTAGAVTLSYSIPSQATAITSDPDDFKALVIVRLGGGNDGYNTFIPADTTTGITTGYAQYKQMRSVRVEDVDLTPELKKYIDANNNLTIGKVDNPYKSNGGVAGSYKKGFYFMDDTTSFNGKIGINSMMPEIAQLALDGKVAVVHNAGNLVKPITKYDKFPPSISAHDGGTRLMNSGQASSVSYQTGWLGRLSAVLGDVNNGSIYPLNINMSAYGMNRMMFSYDSDVMNFGMKGPTNFSFGSNRYAQGGLQDVYKDMVNNYERRDMFHKLFNGLRKKSLLEIETISDDWAKVSDAFKSLKNIYGESGVDGCFTYPSTVGDIHGQEDLLGNYKFLSSFQAAAKLVKIAKDRGLHRIVIYLSVGGWDQHSGLAYFHAKNLRGLSTGIGAFMKAMRFLNLEDKVTVANVSEFSRTLVDNGSGSDHAWGGSYFVIGGAVNGGNYGVLPDMDKNSDYFASRGLMVPTTSFTQHFATLSKWIGATDTQLYKVFPELKNFNQIDLGYMKNS